MPPPQFFDHAAVLAEFAQTHTFTWRTIGPVDLKVDLLLPKDVNLHNDGSAMPLLVYWHGGGLTAGARDGIPPIWQFRKPLEKAKCYRTHRVYAATTQAMRSMRVMQSCATSGSKARSRYAQQLIKSLAACARLHAPDSGQRSRDPTRREILFRVVEGRPGPRDFEVRPPTSRHQQDVHDG